MVEQFLTKLIEQGLLGLLLAGSIYFNIKQYVAGNGLQKEARDELKANNSQLVELVKDSIKADIAGTTAIEKVSNVVEALRRGGAE